MLDTAGNVCDIKLPAHYTPKAQQRLLSMSIFCNQHPNNKMTINQKSWNVQQDPKNHNKKVIDILIILIDNLPMTVCCRVDSLNKTRDQLLSTCLNHPCTQLQSVTATEGIALMTLQTWTHWNEHSSICAIQQSICQCSSK